MITLHFENGYKHYWNIGEERVNFQIVRKDILKAITASGFELGYFKCRFGTAHGGQKDLGFTGARIEVFSKESTDYILESLRKSTPNSIDEVRDECVRHGVLGVLNSEPEDALDSDKLRHGKAFSNSNLTFEVVDVTGTLLEIVDQYYPAQKFRTSAVCEIDNNFGFVIDLDGHKFDVIIRESSDE